MFNHFSHENSGGSIGRSLRGRERGGVAMFPRPPNAWFLPRYMECKRGLAMRKVSVCPSVLPSVRSSVRLSVCLSVCLSNAWTVTKRKKHVPTFLHHMKDHSP